MLAFANMMDLFANELSSLCRCGFPFAFILACPFDRLTLRHGILQENALISCDTPHGVRRFASCNERWPVHAAEPVSPPSLPN